MSLHTEYPFTLPKGYVDDEGTLHRTGVMRLACARDEMEPLRDPRVKENEAYASVIVLARVITELGTIGQVTTKVVEGLFASDFGYLQDFYRIINFGDPSILVSVEPGTPFPRETQADGKAATPLSNVGNQLAAYDTLATAGATECSNL